MADEYGLTLSGPNIKRLDTILDEMHNELSEKWGVNTRQNTESFINHLLTNVADQLAELWELGEDIYYSQYPSSAEGISLDNAAQFGGSTRNSAAKSYYLIHCTGTDGTHLASGTMIASKTNPTTYLTIAEEKEITRNSFNEASIKLVISVANSAYTIAINGNIYSFVSTTENELEILNGIKNAITDINFSCSIDDNNKVLVIKSNDKDSSNSMVLSENITTDTVTTLINFGTVNTGDILLPDGSITEIIKADAGLIKVNNQCGYIPGNDEETDSEFRQSYIDKIFNRSSMMLDSIRSSILNNVQGAESVIAYENATNEVDEFGRPPHSIEIIVDGGSENDIAQQIFNNKAAGISTYGTEVVHIKGLYEEDIPVRFSRPNNLFVWFHIGITLQRNELLPSNYVELIKDVIVSKVKQLNTGEDVVPQEFISDIFNSVAKGISYIDIKLFSSEKKTDVPNNTYPKRSIVVSSSQRAFTDKTMIEVTIDNE